MKIEDLSKFSDVDNSGNHVSEYKVLLKNGSPHCYIHGAMNKISDSGIWRCLMCNVGCHEVNYQEVKLK